MITNENKKLAQWAMEFALKNGCQASRVSLYNGSSSSFEIRDMKIDRLQQASENSLVIQLFVDGRYGSFSTNRLDKKELEKRLLDRGCGGDEFSHAGRSNGRLRVCGMADCAASPQSARRYALSSGGRGEDQVAGLVWVF